MDFRAKPLPELTRLRDYRGDRFQPRDAEKTLQKQATSGPHSVLATKEWSDRPKRENTQINVKFANDMTALPTTFSGTQLSED
jgi:hypothetical protein